MIKEKFSSNVGINHFYKLFLRRKIKFPKGYFFFGKFSKRRISLTEKLHKALILTYFDVYFEEFYSHLDTQYFPLSGELVKAQGKGFYKNKESFVQTESVNWIWYMRPAMNYITNMKIIKLKGSSNRLDKLEKKFKLNFDIALIPKVNNTLKILNTNNKLYK